MKPDEENKIRKSTMKKKMNKIKYNKKLNWIAWVTKKYKIIIIKYKKRKNIYIIFGACVSVTDRWKVLYTKPSNA